MSHGKIVQSGTHQELIQKEGTYKELCLAQELKHSEEARKSEIASKAASPAEEKTEASVWPNGEIAIEVKDDENAEEDSPADGVETDKSKKKKKEPNVPVGRLFKYARPEAYVEYFMY